MINSGGGADDIAENIVQSEGFLGTLHTKQAPWVYRYNLETWIYLTYGDWNTPNGIWTYIINSRQR